MTEYRAHHDHTSCPFCEPRPLEGFCRHWKVERKVGSWHIIADGPDLIQRLARQAHFVTILAYRPSTEGGAAHYRGPLYWEGDAHDPADVLEDMRRCIVLLQVEYDCRPESIRTWLSGRRSLHVTIPPKVIGAEEGHPLLPQIYAAMIEQLFPCNVAPTLDRSIYSGGKGRMWRLVNRQRSDTGRYKIPLTMQEVLHKPYADLEALTLYPRKGIFWPSDEDLSPCPGLVQLYQEIVAAIERHTAHSRPLVRGSERPSGQEGVLFHAFRGRWWLGPEIQPGKWAAECPWQSDHTQGESFDTSTILFAPGDGEVTGWFHCSHGHCAGRTLQDVLSLFMPDELDAAKVAAGLIGHDWRSRSILRRRRGAEEIARSILSKRREGAAG